MTCRRDLIKAGAIAAMAGAVPSSVTCANPMPEQHARTFWPDGAPMVICVTANSVPYEVGIAKYSELAKGMMLGDKAGILKLLLDPETHKLLGVHALGQRATEIIHIGQARPYSSMAGR